MYYQSRGSKYGAKKHVYGEHVYHSKREAMQAQELDLRKRAKDIKEWERQYPIKLEVNGYHICTTKVDFLIHHNDGLKELLEVKGFETRDYKLIKKLIEAIFIHEHPNWIYTVVK